MYQTGIWREGNASNLLEKCRKYFFLGYCIIFQIFNDLSAYISDDVNETIFLTEIGVFYSVITFKQVYLLWKKDEIMSLLNDPITTHSTEYRDTSNYVNGKLKKFLRFLHIYLWMLGITSTFIGMSCFPIFTNERKLPYFISYSFEWTESEIVYWIMYGFVTLAIVYGYLFNLVTIFIWYLMFNYSLAYEVLGNQLRNLGVYQETNEKFESCGTKDSDLYHVELIRSINVHRNIFTYETNPYLIRKIKFKKIIFYHRTIERFKSCFYALFFIQMTTSGLSICVSTYNMAYVSTLLLLQSSKNNFANNSNTTRRILSPSFQNSPDNIIQSVIFIVVLLYGVFDIFLVMYLANEITWASDCLSYCLFESNWLDQTERCKKSVLILGEIFKRPQQLVILIFPMNLETFTRVSIFGD